MQENTGEDETPHGRLLLAHGDVDTKEALPSCPLEE